MSETTGQMTAATTPSNHASQEAAIRADERKRCVHQVQRFAAKHVAENRLNGDSAKAQGWVLLQAAADLRNIQEPKA